MERTTEQPKGRAPVLLAAAAVVLAAGCAALTALGDHYVPPPPGTSWVMARTDSGSFGSASGNVVTNRREQEWQGERVVAYEAPGLTQLLRPDGKLVAFKNGDKLVATFDPPLGMAYPLQVGKTTVTKHQVTVYPSKQVFPMQVTQTVEALEDVTVPAGQFKAFRIRWIESNGNENTYWQDPRLGFSVKTVLTRTAAHSAGIGRRESVLLSVTGAK